LETDGERGGTTLGFLFKAASVDEQAPLSLIDASVSQIEDQNHQIEEM
jgi:hypothetical protein